MSTTATPDSPSPTRDLQLLTALAESRESSTAQIARRLNLTVLEFLDWSARPDIRARIDQLNRLDDEIDLRRARAARSIAMSALSELLEKRSEADPVETRRTASALARLASATLNPRAARPSLPALPAGANDSPDDTDPEDTLADHEDDEDNTNDDTETTADTAPTRIYRPRPPARDGYDPRSPPEPTKDNVPDARTTADPALLVDWAIRRINAIPDPLPTYILHDIYHALDVTFRCSRPAADKLQHALFMTPLITSRRTPHKLDQPMIIRDRAVVRVRYINAAGPPATCLIHLVRADCHGFTEFEYRWCITAFTPDSS